MKSVGILIGAIVVAVGSVFAQPKIESAAGTQLDFGESIHGTVIERTVFIRNVGTDTLHIKDVKGSCGCTATLMSQKNIAPNDSGKLSISFNTTGYNGKASKVVYVSSDDPTTESYVIQFSTNVRHILDVSPTFLSFNDSQVGAPSTQTLTIKNPSDKDAVKITAVKPQSGELHINLMKTKLMPGEETQLQATYKPSKAGSYQGTIEVQTDSKLQPKFEIKYFATAK
jgi:hypothetical protein